MTSDERLGDAPAGLPDQEWAGAGRGGTWLTYRYRFGGEGTAEASGTIKAPSVLTAARRLLARRGLADALGPEPAYLRLRAAGEHEVLFRVARPGPGDGDAVDLAVVPADTYRFAQGTASPDADGRDSPGS
jgi:hypothetical protein